MQFTVGIVGTLCMLLVLAEAQRPGRPGPGGPKGPGPLGDLCENQPDTRTRLRKARTCGKEMKSAADFGADFDPEALKANVTDCATDNGIELPELPEGPGGRGPPGRRGGKKGGPGGRGGPGGIFKKLEEKIGAENAIILRECVLTKQGRIDASGQINRQPIREALNQAFTDDLTTQAALLIAVDSCPEPVDFQISELLQCLGKTCIENVTV